MAKPDLDDGYFPIAYELFAAIAAAGFSSGELIVLWEVFAQTYGRSGRKAAELSPTRIGRRCGLTKRHVVRSITGLVDSGVLARAGEGLYQFIKDYERWTLGAGGPRRLSPALVAYAASAPHLGRSHWRDAGTYQVPHVQKYGDVPGPHMGTYQVPNGDVPGPHMGTYQVPPIPISEKEIQSESQTNPPLSPPRGGRVRGRGSSPDRGRQPHADPPAVARRKSVIDEFRNLPPGYFKDEG